MALAIRTRRHCQVGTSAWEYTSGHIIEFFGVQVDFFIQRIPSIFSKLALHDHISFLLQTTVI